MKTQKVLAFVATLLLAIVFVSCSTDDALAPGDNRAASQLGDESNTPEFNMSEAEESCLHALLEKQKLHRDIYTLMAEKNQKSVFENLSLRDELFMERLAVAVDKYDLENPTANRVRGDFSDEQIQQLYDDFVLGDASTLEQLLKYAIQMEESMIAEIQVHRAGVSDKADLIQIYSNLLDESEDQLDMLHSAK